MRHESRTKRRADWRRQMLAGALIAGISVAGAAAPRTQVAAAAPGSIVVNGDFETPAIADLWLPIFPPGFDGWTVEAGSVDIVRDLYAAASGKQSIDLDGACCEPGSISQLVPTTPGQSYTLSFAFAGNPDPNPICDQPNINQMEVFWGTTSLGVFSFDTTGHTLAEPGWQQITLPPVTASANATKLRFTSLTPGACGPSLDNVALIASDAAVAIDIKPGSSTNPINLRSRGVVPVALLSSATFDATAMVVSTICFGDAEGAAQRDCTLATRKAHRADVNADGRVDLVFHFEVQETGIDAGDTQACLTGRTTSGLDIEACDTIRP